jgi:cation:H+ antiporter
MILWDVGVFLFLCITLWFGTGLIVSSIDRFAKNSKLSTFSVSFFLLGMLTSLPEIAVGASAVLEGTPEVFVGNLLGGIPILFLLVIPILAIFGNGVKINHEINSSNLFITSLVVAAPALFVMDRKVTNPEAVVLIFLYLFLFIILEEKKGGIMSLIFQKKKTPKKRNGFVMVRVLMGAVIVFVSAHFLLEETLYFARLWGVLPFYVSLIALSLGTNIPELSLAIRSVIQGKKDIALGDYMGSAAANTLLFGIFTLLTPAESFNVNHSMITFGFITGGLAMFYYFYKSKHDISRREGFMLLGMYILFVYLELHRS